jgi:AraC-like DNA-binding protein
VVDQETYVRLCRSRDFLAASAAERVTLEDAARKAYLSPFHFQRLFLRTFGESPHEFITRRRIEHAKMLLASGNLSVTEVCLEVGYSSLGSFSSRFHALVGKSPSQYQREMQRVFGYYAPWRIRFVPHCFLYVFGVEESQESRSVAAGTRVTL